MNNVLLVLRGFGAKGSNGSSVGIINGDLATLISAAFLIFVLYIAIRVMISLRQEKNEELSKSKQLLKLTKRHVKFKKK